jgi:hypothetical protein
MCNMDYGTQENISEKLMVYMWNLTVQFAKLFVPSSVKTVDIFDVRYVKRGIKTVGCRTDLINHCRISIISVNM